MTNKYKLNGNFRHWKKGDIVEKYIYNRFPQEFKDDHCELVVEEEPKVEQVVVEKQAEPEVQSWKSKRNVNTSLTDLES